MIQFVGEAVVIFIFTYYVMYDNINIIICSYKFFYLYFIEYFKIVIWPDGKRQS